MSSQQKRMFSAVSALALMLTAWTARSPGVVADEADARRLLKAMSDYVGTQQAIAFDYDAILEVVTKDRQKLQLVSSGMVSLARPDKIRTTRSGGFVDIETVFDGKTLTLFGKNKNIYTRVELPGSLDNLVNELHKKYERPLPAADLFLTRAHDEMTADVTDVKDLGSGVVGGSSATTSPSAPKTWIGKFWVTQGERPRPCRYVNVHGNRGRAAVHRPASELEERHRGRHAGLHIQATVRCEADQHRRAQGGEGHGQAAKPLRRRRQVMNTSRKLRAVLLIGMNTLGLIVLGDRSSIPVFHDLATTVKAEVGRPLTPVSARRCGAPHVAAQLIGDGPPVGLEVVPS